MDAYVMESMGYVTAGILDSVVHPDAAVESAIVKVHEVWVYVVCVSLITGWDSFERAFNFKYFQFT